MDHVRACETLSWQQKGPIECTAVDGEQVDLIDAVCLANVAVPGTPRAAYVYHDDIFGLAQAAPFALNPVQLACDVERHVSAPVLGHWLQDRNA
jgi:hypothetical protein